jgi:hypothetical protein
LRGSYFLTNIGHTHTHAYIYSHNTSLSLPQNLKHPKSTQNGPPREKNYEKTPEKIEISNGHEKFDGTMWGVHCGLDHALVIVGL